MGDKALFAMRAGTAIGLIGLALNFSGVNPITALFYTAVINGLVAPVLLVIIILITGNRRIMGRHTNPAVVSVFG